jgi:hypothetical protein
MRFRAISVVLGIGLACGVWASACSAPDPGAVTFVPRDRTSGIGSSGGTSSSGGSSSSSSSGGTSSSGDGGSSSGGTDAGHDTGPPNAFSTAPAFKAGTSLQSSTQDSHTAGLGSTNPANNNCMQCHVLGDNPAPNMTIGGGTVSLGGTPTAGIEVRVVDAKTGAQVADAYTDENGNFYVNGAGLAGTYAVGVRNGNKTSLMVGTIPNGACNQGGTCHGKGGAQAAITLQ